LYASNIENGTIVYWRTAGFGGHDHAEERIGRFKASTKHETISKGRQSYMSKRKKKKRDCNGPGFKKVENSRDTRETELAYKDGSV